MGYTHYWKSSQLSPETWAKITSDAKKLIAATKVPLAHEFDTPSIKPVVNAKEIFFNGVGDDGHETFVLQPELQAFEFCKTAHKPYDEVVTAILAVYAEHAGDDVLVSSDGDEEDWKPGLVFATQTLGRAIKYPVARRSQGDDF